MIPELRIACDVCESGAVIEQYKHIIFHEGLLTVFNGAVLVQAPSSIDAQENFAVNEERLVQAISACEEDADISLKGDFLVFKKKKLTVRIRKLDAAPFYKDIIPQIPRKDRVEATGLHEALRAVAPFMSADASRPWTVSVLLRGKFAWATNNLSLVKYPLPLDFDCCIPSPAVPILSGLKSIDWIARNKKQIVVASGKVRLTFPEASADWPDVKPFFAKAPKKLPVLPPELFDAAKIVEKFAERFVSLRSEKVEGKLSTIESEYEIEVPNGKGAYPAKLLLLVLNNATHADFSTYPEPIFFAGKKLRGVAVGARPEEAAAK